MALVLGLLGSSSAKAQSSGATPEEALFDEGLKARAMTLQEALAYARAHQPAIQVARARLAAAQAALSIPRAQWRPVVGATAQLLGATANNTTGTYVTDPAHDTPRVGGGRSTDFGSLRPYPTSFVGIGVSQEIYDFGRIAALEVEAKSLVDIERLRGSADRLDAELAVRQAYYAVHAARAVVTAAESAFVRSTAHRDLASAGVRAGLRAPIEETRAEADLARFDVGRARARGGLLAVQAVFAAVVGTGDGLLDAAGEAPAASPLPPLRDAVAAASARDPAIGEALAHIASQEARTTAIGAELRPNLFFTATLSGRAGAAPPSSGSLPVGGGFLPVVPNWDVGLVLSWPMVDGVVSARRTASEAREQTAHAELDAVRHDLVAAIQKAFFGFTTARASLPALERALFAAKKNEAQASERFKQGLGSSVEVADAQSLLTEAEIQLALGRFQVARARLVFGRAIAEGL